MPSDSPHSKSTGQRRESEGMILRSRLTEAGLTRNRIIPLDAGQKSATFDHTDPANRYDIGNNAETTAFDYLHSDFEYDANYGVYAGDGLVILDIDIGSPPDELEALPSTFTTSTPHDGEHRYYELTEDIEELKDAIGVANPQPSWGEVRARNQYVVGPGSQLDGCDKCDQCSQETGGKYTIRDDTEIAEIELDELLTVVTADDEYDTNQQRQQTEQTEWSDTAEHDHIGFDGDVDQRLEKARAADETLDALWRGDYAAAGYPDDRSRAECALAWRLAFWFEKDKEVVRQLMQRAQPRKWTQRTDDAYRESVLDAVDLQPDVYTGAPESDGPSKNPDLSEIEVVSDPQTEPISWDEAHQRCLDLIRQAIRDKENVLIEALPTIGKSIGAIEAIDETDVQATILTQREDLYDEAVQRCRERGLEHYILPSVYRSCPTFQGEHGEYWEGRVRSLHGRGATALEIHDRFQQAGSPLPCDQNGSCPTREVYDFDPDEYNVLIGHYLHANMTEAINDRHVILDEFVGDAFDSEIEQSAITDVLERENTNLSTVTEVIESDPPSSKDAPVEGDRLLDELGLRLSDDNELADVFDTTESNKSGRRAALVLYAGDDVEVNDYNRAELDDGTIGLYDRKRGKVILREPPALDSALSVIALDGTPTKRLWESTLGIDFEHTRVLTDPERYGYITETKDWEFVQTTNNVYPYSGGSNVNLQKDRALIEQIRINHERYPALISTQAALRRYETEYPELIEELDTRHYGELKSSNAFASERLGAVIGSRHFPRHEFIAKEAAFENESINPEGQGLDKTYNNTYGDQLLRHMREHETAQAMMRFGRDGDGARVYVHTAAVPDWMPRKKISTEITTHSDGMQQVLTVLQTTEEPWTVSGVTDDERVEITRRAVSEHLKRLVDRGYLNKERAGRSYEYRAVEMDRLNRFGFVDLEFA